jgi:hypothetical protein
MLSPGKTLPFVRGATLYETESPGTQPNILGQTYVFEGFPVEKVEAAGQPNTGMTIVGRVCKNASGVNLKPGRIVNWLNDATNPFGTAVGGYSWAATDRPAGVVDEFLPAAGVQPNDLFWLIQFGYTKVRSLGSGSHTIDIGDLILPAAGTSTTHDDAGRVTEITGTIDTVAETLSAFGRAQEACTTTDTLFRAFINTLRLMGN